MVLNICTQILLKRKREPTKIASFSFHYASGPQHVTCTHVICWLSVLLKRLIKLWLLQYFRIDLTSIITSSSSLGNIKFIKLGSNVWNDCKFQSRSGEYLYSAPSSPFTAMILLTPVIRLGYKFPKFASWIQIRNVYNAPSLSNKTETQP